MSRAEEVKILVAEDEELLREAVATVITRECGAEVRTAADGREALRMYHELKPDIVITDIRMPYKDGLELVRDIAEAGGDPCIMILSAYSEFEYAKKAIEFGVFLYLVKSLDYDELTQAIRRAIGHVRRRRADRRRLEDHEAYLEKYKTELLNKKLLDALRGMQPVGDTGLSPARRLVLWKMTLQPTVHAPFRLPEESGLVFFAVENIVREVVGELGVPFQFIVESDDSFLLLLWAGESPSAARNYEMMQRIRQTAQILERGLEHFLRFRVDGEWSNIVPLSEARSAYLSVSAALKGKLDSGLATAGLASGAAGGASGPERDSRLETQTAEMSLAAAIRQNNRREIGHIVGRLLFGACRKLDEARVRALQLLYYLCGLFEAEGAVRVSAQIRSINIPGQLSMKRSVEALREWFLGVMDQLADRYHEKPHLSKHPIIRDIEERILLDPRGFSLKDYADGIGMNAAYLSELFRKETGMNLTHFIVGVKMNAAMRMLRDPGCKVYEVAMALGYKDGRHFSQAFRKFTGMTPKQYQSDADKQFPKQHAWLTAGRPCYSQDADGNPTI